MRGFTTVNQEYATSEFAKLLGVSKRTLYRWLKSGELTEPKQFKAGKAMLRVWNEADIKRAMAVKAAMRRGRPSSKPDQVSGTDQQLLALRSQLNRYHRIVKLGSKEQAALQTLQTGLDDRLAKRGLEW